MGIGQVVNACRLGGTEGGNHRAYLSRVFEVGMGEKIHGGDRPGPVRDDANKGGIDPVERRPGHETDDEVLAFRSIRLPEPDFTPRAIHAGAVPVPGRAGPIAERLPQHPPSIPAPSDVE